MAERDSDIETWARAHVGTVLRGKYRLDRVLGVGGMAAVYKATHRNQAEFAVKMLHPQMSLSADVRSRFLREGYAANSVKHPGAVLVVDDDVAEDGAAFLVMELLGGISCEALWERSEGRLDHEAASAILIQLLDVLASAHANGVVHRDIKPANLFLTRPGAVKVLDFGIARAREALASGDHGTQTGLTLGTPGFMSPEQARGRVREIDGRTDLWAAGATFFSLVSGQLVHEAETAHELMIKAATQPARTSLRGRAAPARRGRRDRRSGARLSQRGPLAVGRRDARRADARAIGDREPGGGRRIPRLVERWGASARPSHLAAGAVRGASDGPPAIGTTGALSMNDRGASPGRSRAWSVGASVVLAAMLAVGALAAKDRHRVRSVPHEAALQATPETPAAVSRLPETTAAVVAVVAKDDAVASADAGALPAPKQADAGARRRSEPRTSRPAPACNPNFTLDDEGRKHFKPECFLKHSPKDPMKHRLAPILASLTTVALLVPRPAHAARPTVAECLAASDASLQAGNEHKLRAERADLLVCAASSCPVDIRKECARRVEEVNGKLPTVIFEARDTAGNDRSAVRVTLDGELLTERLEGTAVSIDPGEHTFLFEAAGETAVTKKLVVRQGQKDRREAVVFLSSAPASVAIAPAATKAISPPPAPPVPLRAELVTLAPILASVRRRRGRGARRAEGSRARRRRPRRRGAGDRRGVRGDGALQEERSAEPLPRAVLDARGCQPVERRRLHGERRDRRAHRRRRRARGGRRAVVVGAGLEPRAEHAGRSRPGWSAGQGGLVVNASRPSLTRIAPSSWPSPASRARASRSRPATPSSASATTRSTR